MGLTYETEQIYTGPRAFKSAPDPIKQYIKHYEKYKFLKFVFDNTKDFLERRTANAEMTKYALPKMARWESMIPHTALKDLEEAKKEIDKLWEGK